MSNEAVSREDLLQEASPPPSHHPSPHPNSNGKASLAAQLALQQKDTGPLDALRSLLEDVNFDPFQDRFWELQRGLGSHAPDLRAEYEARVEYGADEHAPSDIQRRERATASESSRRTGGVVSSGSMAIWISAASHLRDGGKPKVLLGAA